MEIIPGADGKYKLRDWATVAAWPTINAFDRNNENTVKDHDINRGYLRGVVSLAAWATPTVRDWKDGTEVANVPINALLGRQVW
ncbi:MAG: hypothetical protein AB7F32_04975 [Victivallaceae bacterium]